MSKPKAPLWVAGVDGCRGGWMICLRDLSGGALPRLRVVPRFADIVDAPERPVLIAADMPIGLPDRVGPGGRGPERLIRPLLEGRRSSVFSVPARAAVEAPDYRAACAAALAASDPPRKLSQQTFHLFPKIREIDALLRSRPELRERVRESHPELVFWRMNGEQALARPKKTAAGAAERRAILTRAGLHAPHADAPPPKGAARDDLLDSIALSWAAERMATGAAQPFPDPPGRDSFGLPLAIWA
jgi:predicted RNase H-like nuclease